MSNLSLGLNCVKRGKSNWRSPVCQASKLTIRPWMLGWGGLMGACGTVATCVWSAYGLHPSHFNCLCREGIKLTHMNGIRATTLAFCSGGCRLDSCQWWPYSMPTGAQRQPMVDRQSGHPSCPVTQHKGGSYMLVARKLWWTNQWRQTSGGQTVGG